MPTTQSALRAGRAKTGTGVPCPYKFFLMRAACDLQTPPYDMTEFARQLRRGHAPLSLGRVLLAQAVRLPAAGRLKARALQHCLLVSNRIATLDRYSIFPGFTNRDSRRPSRRWDIYVFSPVGVRSQAGPRATFSRSLWAWR